MKLLQFETNLDDMTPETIAYVQEQLFENGACDVWQESILMKKGRLAIKLCALAMPKYQEDILDVFWTETSTLGVRVHEVERIELEREEIKIEILKNEIRAKVTKRNGKALRLKPEHDDCVRLAKRKKLALQVIKKEVLKRE